MSLDEPLDSLGISLHDAELHAFHMDYVHRRLKLELEVCIREPDVAERREVYRPALLTIDDVRFLYVEPPRDTTELHMKVQYGSMPAKLIRLELMIRLFNTLDMWGVSPACSQAN